MTEKSLTVTIDRDHAKIAMTALHLMCANCPPWIGDGCRRATEALEAITKEVVDTCDTLWDDQGIVARRSSE